MPPLMMSQKVHHRIHQYADEIRLAMKEGLTGSNLVERVTQLKKKLLSQPINISIESEQYSNGNYGRLLLHQDEEFEFIVAAMFWPPGSTSPIHDHGTWGVVGVAEGMLDVTKFDRLENEPEPILFSRPTIRAFPGMVDTVNPPHDEIHLVANPSKDSITISIHTYGKLMITHNVFDIKSGLAEERMLPQLTYPRI